MSVPTKSECVEMYGVRVIPGDATDAMIEKGVWALKEGRKSDLNDASLALFILDAMCETGDLTEID